MLFTTRRRISLLALNQSIEMNVENASLNDPATLAHIARLSLSSVREKKHIFDTLSRFDREQSELLDVVSSLENGQVVMAPFTSVAFIEGKITNCDELLVKLSSSEDQLYAERTREQTRAMLRKRQVFAREKLLRAEQELRTSEIEHRETMRVLSEKFESLNGGSYGGGGTRSGEEGEPKSRVIEGPNGRKTVLTPRDGEIVDVLEIDETAAANEEGEEREDEVMQMRNEKEIERDREERKKAKGELESWLLKIEEMERLEEQEEEDRGEEEEEEEEEVSPEGVKSTNVASSSRSTSSQDHSASNSQKRIQIRAGLDAGMPVIERGFEKEGEGRDGGARSPSEDNGEKETKPMSKFKMRQLGLL
jgi:prefoldin subunit 5